MHDAQLKQMFMLMLLQLPTSALPTQKVFQGQMSRDVR